MSFLFPDAARIANIGHVNTVSVLSTDQLRDYVVYVKMPKDAFFTDTFMYNYDGMKLACPDKIGASRYYVNCKSICDAFCDSKHVNVHHGSQHVFFKHAFKLGDPVTISSSANMFIDGQVNSSSVNVQVYGVFLNALDGSPVSSWSVNSDDGAVEVLYEYYSNGTSFLNNSTMAVDSLIAESLGIPGFKSGSLISGGGTLVMNGLRNKCNSNIAYLTSKGPAIMSTTSSSVNDCIWNDRPNPSTVRLVRAFDKNIQTLIFATVCDTSVPSSAVTDVYALFRCVPGIASVTNVIPVMTCNANSNPDGVVAFEDACINYASVAHPVYIRKLMTLSPGAQPDPWRAKRIMFPAIEVSFTTSVADTVIADGKRKLSVAHIHKSMPKGGLGTRLLQMTSVLCSSDYDCNECTGFDLSRDTQSVHDILASMAKKVDLSQEPGQTHDCICDSINAFFDDSAKRTSFLNEFNAKFPGVLTAPSITQAAYNGVTLNRAFINAIDNKVSSDISLCVFLTIDFCVPDDTGDCTKLKTNRLNAVPIIFCLS